MPAHRRFAMIRLFAFLTLVLLVACAPAWGDVILVNESDEPQGYAVAYGESAWARLPSPKSARGLSRLKPGDRVVIGRARALADSGGVAVAVYSVPDAPGARPQNLRTDAIGAAFLREAFGDTVLGDD